MHPETMTSLQFGDASDLDRSLSDQVRGLVGSEILKIAADIRKLVASGEQVCNLTVGDFDSRHFPIPAVLLGHIQDALREGETNYPPSNGVAILRDAVAGHVARSWGVRYPKESVLIAGGARPILYATYRCVLDPGEQAVYPVPSWNNNHYAWVSGAESAVVTTRAEDGFMPTLAQLKPHFETARLLCLNTPLNPTGTVIAEDALRSIVEAVVEENLARQRQGRRALFLLYDQIYAALVFGSARHFNPVTLVPESAPWVISLDGVSKAFSATGLRVGWVLAAPGLIARMNNLIGHMGAWAPKPEQVGVARFLDDPKAVDEFQTEMNGRVRQRLDALYRGFSAMKSAGCPVDCISPQGAIYLSLRLDLIGRSFEGTVLETNEAIRRLLLDRSGVAVVPFQAFGFPGDTGWFRLSVGAVSMEEIAEALPRIREVLDGVR